MEQQPNPPSGNASASKGVISGRMEDKSKAERAEYERLKHLAVFAAHLKTARQVIRICPELVVSDEFPEDLARAHRDLNGEDLSNAEEGEVSEGSVAAAIAAGLISSPERTFTDLTRLRKIQARRHRKGYDTPPLTNCLTLTDLDGDEIEFLTTALAVYRMADKNGQFGNPGEQMIVNLVERAGRRPIDKQHIELSAQDCIENFGFQERIAGAAREDERTWEYIRSWKGKENDKAENN